MLSSVEIGSIISGKVIKIKPFGAIISINNNIQGLVHISQVSSSFVQNINEYLAVGDVVNVKVLSVDTKTNKVALSIKEVNSKPVAVEKKGIISKSTNNNVFSKSQNINSSLDDKLKEWLKQSNERQAGISKRNNRR